MTRSILRILVPIDFSTTSQAALGYATMLATRFGATLHLLHVVEDPFAVNAFAAEAYFGSAPAIRERLIDEAAAKLTRVLPEKDRDQLEVTSEARVGNVASTIVMLAETEGFDLIVMGTHGRSGMAHLLMGSVAEKVVRQAPCPVLTVRDDARRAMAAERDLFANEYVPAE